jgi:hypothetical protein
VEKKAFYKVQKKAFWGLMNVNEIARFEGLFYLKIQRRIREQG